jgi:hypothetical protein
MDLEVVREKQPQGHDGVCYSVEKMIELIRKDRLDPSIVAFGRRALRDAGLLGMENQDPVAVARAIWDAIKKQGIGWVPDPVKAEFLAAPRHMVPSAEGRDDALMVAGDCDELSMLQACVALAVALAVGVETSALCLHSYSASRAIGHVLNAVYDTKAGEWIRVDHTGSWGFGQFKKPTHETLVSLPSGRVICSGDRCDRAAPAPVEDGTPWDHGRLAGLPRVEVLGFSTLGDMAGDDEGALAAFSELLELKAWDLTGAMDSLASAVESMHATFDYLGLSTLQRDQYWPLSREMETAALFDSAELALGAIRDVQTGNRRWALDENGDFAIERKEGETQALSSSGQLINVLAGPAPHAPPGLGELPLPPVAIAALALLGIVVTAGAYLTIISSMESLADIARSAESAAAQDVLKECLKGGGDPERCAKIGAAIKGIREAREVPEAEKEKAKADQAKERTKQIGLAVGVVAAGAATGAFFYFGGPALVTSWLASRKKAAA